MLFARIRATDMTLPIMLILLCAPFHPHGASGLDTAVSSTGTHQHHEDSDSKQHAHTIVTHHTGTAPDGAVAVAAHSNEGESPDAHQHHIRTAWSSERSLSFEELVSAADVLDLTESGEEHLSFTPQFHTFTFYDYFCGLYFIESEYC